MSAHAHNSSSLRKTARRNRIRMHPRANVGSYTPVYRHSRPRRPAIALRTSEPRHVVETASNRRSRCDRQVHASVSLMRSCVPARMLLSARLHGDNVGMQHAIPTRNPAFQSCSLENRAHVVPQLEGTAAAGSACCWIKSGRHRADKFPLHALTRIERSPIQLAPVGLPNGVIRP